MSNNHSTSSKSSPFDSEFEASSAPQPKPEIPPVTAPHSEALGWEREVLEKLALSAVVEQRRARRWGIFFKSLLFLYLFVLAGIAAQPLLEKKFSGDAMHTAVIDVTGLISESSETSAISVIRGLRNAIENDQTKGIILRMNTPGGTPVQSAYIYDEIRRIKKEKPELPIYAVVSDICASGGYYIASATDKIFVNESSIVGSIGVIMNGFGFVNAMEKLGVERRLLIAGEHKAILDPFLPISEQEKGHIQTMLNGIHQQFIDSVKQGRGERLKVVENPDLFSGLVWTGSDSIKLGLTDGISTVDLVAKELVGAEELVNFTPERSFFDRFAKKVGTSFGGVLSTALQSMDVPLR